MAKTYEALEKSAHSSHEDHVPAPTFSDWRFLDLKNTRQKGDLEKKIAFCMQKNNAKIFNFTSSRSKEGVSTIVANLAKYMAVKKKEKKILLIDANLHAPVQHIAFDNPRQPGLNDVLSGNTLLSEAIQAVKTNKLDLLPCGNPRSDSAGDIEQEKFYEIISEIREQYDYVLIDSAPLLISADSLSTALSADVTFLIVQSLKVQKEVAEKAKLLLQDNECHIGGVILNRIKQVIPGWMYKKI